MSDQTKENKETEKPIKGSFAVKTDVNSIAKFHALADKSGLKEKGQFFTLLVNDFDRTDKNQPATDQQSLELIQKLTNKNEALQFKNEALEKQIKETASPIELLSQAVKPLLIFQTSDEFNAVFVALFNAGKVKTMDEFCGMILKPYQEQGYYKVSQEDLENVEKYMQENSQAAEDLLKNSENAGE